MTRATTPRLVLAAGALQTLLGLLLAVSDATPEGAPPSHVHAVLLASGVATMATASALALLPAFTGRERPDARLAWLVPLSCVALDALVLPFGLLAPGWLGAPLVLALALAAARGPPLRDHEPPFAQGRPHLLGDRVAAAALAAGSAGSLVGVGLLFVSLDAGVLVTTLAGALPLAGGVLAFLLPRLLGAPLKGSTVLAASLGVLLLATPALALPLLLGASVGYRYAAAGVLLAHVLAVVAFARVSMPKPAEAPVERLRPLLRASAALSILAGLAALLAFAGDAPSELVPLAGYAHLALAFALAACATHLAAPFLGLAPRGRLWGSVGGTLLIVGLLLLAPTFQYPYSPVPASLVTLLGAALTATPFLLPARAPRRRDRRKR